MKLFKTHYRYLVFSAVLVALVVFHFWDPQRTRAAANIYYVDQTGGDDSKDGLAQSISGGAGPWKTIAKVNSSSFSGDDQILFKRGEVWREQLTVPSSGTSGHPIIFGKYGSSGADPIISGSDVKSSGWSQSTTSKKVFIASGTSTAVPADWNSSSNTIETIGGGGAGHDGNSSANKGAGGGGGAYSKSVNVSLTPSATVGYAIGVGGATNGANGTDTFFCSNNTNTPNALAGNSVVCGSHGGTGATNNSVGALGGSTTGGIASGTGNAKYAGGKGGDGTSGGAGGGGAAGPSGIGGAGGNATVNAAGSGGGGNGGGSAGNGPTGAGSGGNGGDNFGGTGHGVRGGGAGTNGGGGAGSDGDSIGGAGGAGIEWDATHGSGGGGGGGQGSYNGGAAGLYGGGGAGSGGSSSNFGAGAAGIIVLSYDAVSANVYQSAVTTEPKVVYFNGTLGTHVASVAAIDAEYKWYWAANVLYVYSPSGDPAAYYASSGIEIGQRNSAIHTNNKTYLTIDGLTLRDGNNKDDSIVHVGSTTVTGFIIQNCTIERGVSAGINLIGSTTATSATVTACTIRDVGAYAILVDYVYTTATVSNSSFSGNGWAAVIDNLPYADITSILDNFNIFGNTFTNVAPNGDNHGDNLNYCHSIYSAPSAVAMNIHHNVFHGNRFGDGVKATSSATIYNNLFYGNSGSGIEVGSNVAVNIAVLIYNNILYGNCTNNNQGAIEESGKGSGTLSLTAYNNCVYKNGTTAEIRIQDNITALVLKNNAIYSNTGAYAYRSPTQSAATIDNNCVYGPSGNPVYYNGASRSWATWQGYGFDTVGVNADPLFVSTSDFHLQATSPCINAGVDVGLTSDYVGKPLRGLPDIGAYEYQPALGRSKVGVGLGIRN